MGRSANSVYVVWVTSFWRGQAFELGIGNEPASVSRPSFLGRGLCKGPETDWVFEKQNVTMSGAL